MHLGTAALLDFHSRHQDDEALVLAVITGTRGSTYRKPGAMMLIAADESYEGLISGGCLEGDLLHHAQSVFEDGEPRPVVYDMHSEEDLVWGLGIGCDGVIELLLLRLEGDQHRALFQGIRDSLAERRRVIFALAARPGVGVLAGSVATLDEAGGQYGDEGLLASARDQIEAGWPEHRLLHAGNAAGDVILVNILPQPRILLCGGGADAVPIAGQLASLGWRCMVTDRRPAYASADRFPARTETLSCPAGALEEAIDLSQFDAAVVMSHHLESDAAYLRQLAPLAASGTLRYLGVLGPTARRKRLCEMAEAPDVLIHGPVGLDIGAELPEAIALAVAAEIHAVLNGRDGQSLTTGPLGDGG